MSVHFSGVFRGRPRGRPLGRRPADSAVAPAHGPPEGGDAKTPLASPLYADLKGLPPLHILVGTWEVLMDDSTRFARKAQAAGVAVDLEVWEEMIHIWPFFAAVLPEGRQAIDRMASFIKKHTAPANTSTAR